MLHKKALTQTPLHELIANRWSPRAFGANKPVQREQLLTLLDAARWAPSCFNDQPWRYVVWDRHTDETIWKKAFDCLDEFNQQWVKNTPILILAASDSVFHHNGKPNRWGPYDTGAASENICLQATALGLMAHQMGGFDADKLRRDFGIPETVTCQAMIAVGYQAEPDVLSAELKEKELAERTRLPLHENFFEGNWGAPLKAI